MPKKSQLKKADRQYTNDATRVAELKQKRDKIDEELKKAENDLEISENTYKRVALEIYNYSYVQDMLEKAEKTDFAKSNLSEIKCIPEEEWEINMKPELIRDLISIEDHNRKKTPLWERSPIMRLGEAFVNSNGNE